MDKHEKRRIYIDLCPERYFPDVKFITSEEVEKSLHELTAKEMSGKIIVFEDSARIINRIK